jgi:hypothetical protein
MPRSCKVYYRTEAKASDVLRLSSAKSGITTSASMRKWMLFRRRVETSLLSRRREPKSPLKSPVKSRGFRFVDHFKVFLKRGHAIGICRGDSLVGPSRSSTLAGTLAKAGIRSAASRSVGDNV